MQPPHNTAPTQPSPLTRRRSLLHDSQTFLDSSIVPITKDTILMSDFTPSGERLPHPSRKPTHTFQRYFLENRVIDKYRTTAIHLPHLDQLHRQPPPETLQQSFLNTCVAPLLVDKQFDPPIRYAIRAKGAQPYLEMTCREGVWHIYNRSMFSDIPVGECIARVHSFLSVLGNSLFALVPNRAVLPGVPTMQMEPVLADPIREYSLSIDKIIVGSLVVRKHFFDVVLRNCTKEEALIWLALVVAAELENKANIVGFVAS